MNSGNLMVTMRATLFFLFVIVGYCAEAQWEKVKVEGGIISGVVNATGDVRIFKGIPFAAPPVGALRWRAPQPVKPWNGVRVCDHFGPSPMQGKPVPFSMWTKEFLIPDTPISEDCLYLNVWTGARASAERRPVLVWIYGGGFSSGGAGCPIYDGEAMAQKGIIFVSINYRVGIFGFFAHPELTVESGHHASGNYGLMDQIAALRWVQHNIAAFGGDPGKVTIAGQSAGSMSVSCLVASPLAKGLFERAIGESGAMFGAPAALGTAEVAGQKVLDALKVSSIAAARALPAEELTKQTMGIRFPIMDGYVLPDTVADIFTEGKENKVSLLTGWNADEFGAAPKKALEFQREAGSGYGKDSAIFLRWYPASTDSEATVSARRLSRDQVFGVQNYAWAKVTSAQGNAVYVYRFTRKVPATGDYVKYGAFHTGEVPYVFDNLRFVDRPWKPEDRILARQLSDYWANFVKTGDPNGPELPRWAPFKSPNDPIMVLDVKLVAEPLPDKGALEFLYQRLSGR